MEQKECLLKEQLSKYNPHYLIKYVLKYVDKDILFSNDDRIAIYNYLFQFVHQNSEIAGNEIKIKRLGHLIKLITDLAPYEPMDNILITHHDDNNVYLDEFHKNRFHYYAKRKVSKEYFKIGREILEKFDIHIQKTFGFSIDVFYQTISSLVYESIKNTSLKFSTLESIKHIPNHENVINILSLDILSSSVKLYLIGTHIYCVDMIYLEENAYFIL